MKKGKPIYVVGHKKPDTDSICSSVAYAHYLKKKGENAKPARTGKINEETKFVLKYFKADTPMLLSSAKDKNIILLDHNEETQSPDHIDKAEILEVIDHHKVNFKSQKPIFFYSEPIGATASIIAKLYLHDKKVTLDKKTSGLLLSAILSDTVIFRSPTTTEEDMEIAGTLAKKAGIKNMEAFGLEIKKANASLKGKNPEDIITADFKEYTFGKKKLGVGQIEVCDMEETKKQKEQLISALKIMAKKKKYTLLVLVATDIMAMGSELLFAGNEDYIKKAFGKKPKGNSLYLKGVMSRKKQVVPPLTKVFTN